MIERCPICGKLTGALIGDYPMDAICWGHKQPEPITYYYQVPDFSDLIHDRDEARSIARRLYRKNAELLDTREFLKANLDSYHAENAELRRQLEEYQNGRWHSFETVQAIVKERDELRRQLDVAREALKWHADNEDSGVARCALEEMDGGGYKSARGILPWDVEPADDAIQRLRGAE